MGSTKYGTFVFLMSMFSSVAQFVVPHGLQPSGSKNGGGPFALIGALAWIYYRKNEMRWNRRMLCQLISTILPTLERIPSLKMLDNARFSFLNHSKSPTYMFLATVCSLTKETTPHLPLTDRMTTCSFYGMNGKCRQATSGTVYSE